MKVVISIIDEKYKDGDSVTLNGSHFHHVTSETIIYLPQVLRHSLDCDIEQAFTQHVTHELIHKLIYDNISLNVCRDFDNLGSQQVYKIEGKFSLRNWFGGMLDKEV